MLRDQLISLFNGYAKAKQIAPATVSTRVFNSGKVYAFLCEGKGVTIDRYDHAVAWFDTNWPTGVRWPKGITRPSRKRRAA